MSTLWRQVLLHKAAVLHVWQYKPINQGTSVTCQFRQSHDRQLKTFLNKAAFSYLTAVVQPLDW